MAIQRRTFISASAAASAGLVTHPSANAGYSVSTVVVWNRALIAAVVATATPATISARACSMVHEAGYNAWAAYDPNAGFTLGQMAKRPLLERSDAQKTIAISWAMYTVLVDLFPTQQPVFAKILSAQAGGLASILLFGIIARQVGEQAGNALLQARHQDGSNQLGDLAPGAYSDYSGYVPVNTPDVIVDPTRWQPLRYVNAAGATLVQKYLTPFWGQVRPFALSSASVYRPVMDHFAPSQAEMAELINFSAQLDERLKAQVDFFAQNPGKGSPPTQWMGFAEQVSAKDRNSLDADVKLFFTCAQALHDAGVACWDVKRVYDSVRPITAIPYYLAGQTVTAWAGYDQGIRSILADNWYPYQPATVRTPSFPEYVSGHSTFSFAAASAMAGLRGSDAVTISGTVPVGFITFETNMPSTPQSFSWPSLSAVAAAAGLSRRQCGIHFEQGDLGGRALGAKVGNAVLARCKALFTATQGKGSLLSRLLPF